MAAPIPRQSLGWFFLAQAAVVAPHVPRLPWWLLLVWAVCAAWRIQVYRGYWSWPGKLVKSLIVFTVLAGILAWYRNPTALESAAGTVIALFFLKLLECYQRRDVYLLSFVALFVAGMAFLFDQGLLTALWVFLSFVLVMVSLVALHDPLGAGGWKAGLRPVLALLAQSLPLMLVLFLVFPRIAPIWSVPMPGGKSAHTGMGETMTPGDFTRLAQSTELAFRVTFDGPMPDPELRYWRGLVLGYFDGRTWYPGYGGTFQSGIGNALPPAGSGQPGTRTYEIILEPTGTQWLFALGYAHSATPGVVMMPDGTLASTSPVGSRFRYQVESQALGTASLGVLERRAALRLPENINPRTRAWVAALREKIPGDMAFIQALLQYLNRESFVYTLEPKALGHDSVDDFFFVTREGFCEHYASSMAFALRVAGIPARVVVGYQGGEPSPFQPYLRVSQYDAHAWVEAWVEGQGWLLVDPTAAVAPERIREGMHDFMERRPGFGAGSTLPAWVRGNNILARMRLWFDQIDYRWQKTVLGYDADRQSATLTRLLGEITPARVSLLMMGVFLLAMGGVVLGMLGREWLRPQDPALRAWQRACRQLAVAGYPRAAGEAPGDYARRILQEVPSLGRPFGELTRVYEGLAYQSLAVAQRQQQQRQLHAKVRAFVRESRLRRRPEQARKKP